MFERFFFYCSTSIIILMDSTVPRSVDNGQSSSKSFFSLVKWDIEGIDGIRCRDICFFVFFFYVSLIIICCSEMILLVYTRRCSSSIWKFFFLFFFLHKHTRLRSVGREISLRSRREETEKDRDGKVLVLLPAEAFFFFSETGDAFISGGVSERERGDAKTTAADVNSWHAPFCSTVVLTIFSFFLFAFEGRKFYISIRRKQLQTFTFPCSRRNIFISLFVLFRKFLSNITYIYIYIF